MTDWNINLPNDLSTGQTSTPITPHDSNAQSPMRELYVGTGGTVIGRLRNDTADRTFANVPDGARLPYNFVLIKSTSTTASNMIGIV